MERLMKIRLKNSIIFIVVLFILTNNTLFNSGCKSELNRSTDETGSERGSGIVITYEEIVEHIRKFNVAGYWNFNEIIDGKILDISGNDNDAILNNNGVLAQGLREKGLKLNEDETVIIRENKPLSGFKEMTINFWIKLDDMPERNIMILAKDLQPPFEYRVLVEGMNFSGHAVMNPSGGDWYQGTNIRFWDTEIIENLTDRWIMLTIVYDGEYIYTYSDGVLNDISISLSGNLRKTGSPLYIGRNLQDRIDGFNGTIDELVILEDSLTHKEIFELYCIYTNQEFSEESFNQKFGVVTKRDQVDEDYQIAVYYFPQWHVDEKNNGMFGHGWTEWEGIKNARPRFEGHKQPKVPLWGYEDEADPVVMERKINAAYDSGIDAFKYCWYWNDSGPFLHRALEEGYMNAKNNDKVKFAVMWANHDHFTGTGVVTEETFRTMTDYIIENYFTHPSYWRIDGKPYFSIYLMFTLVESFGSVEKTAQALEDFRNRARDAGIGEIHINVVEFGARFTANIKGEVTNLQDYLTTLNIDSVTSYVWIHHTTFNTFPDQNYADFRDASIKQEERLGKIYHWLPYFPNVTMGWDSSPRTPQNVPYENKGYPSTSITVDNTPEEFKIALQKVKDMIDSGKTSRKIITINAWNEWGEGSFIEPELEYGMGYLDAIKDVFR